MLKRLFLFGKSSWREFAKYFVIGVTSFVLDISSLYLFDRYTHLPHYMAVVISQPFILLYVFSLNKWWAFKSKGITHPQAVRFVLLALTNYLIATTWMWFFTKWYQVHLLGPRVDYLFIRLANVVLAVGWNFLLYKYWVYREKHIL